LQSEEIALSLESTAGQLPRSIFAESRNMPLPSKEELFNQDTLAQLPVHIDTRSFQEQQVQASSSKISQALRNASATAEISGAGTPATQNPTLDPTNTHNTRYPESKRPGCPLYWPPKADYTPSTRPQTSATTSTPPKLYPNISHMPRASPSQPSTHSQAGPGALILPLVLRNSVGDLIPGQLRVSNLRRMPSHPSLRGAAQAERQRSNQISSASTLNEKKTK
jgi:hypothetical protein